MVSKAWDLLDHIGLDMIKSVQSVIGLTFEGRESDFLWADGVILQSLHETDSRGYSILSQ